MRIRRTGWAGVEIESGGEALVIDPLFDAGAVFAPLGDGVEVDLPELAEPGVVGSALAGLVTHLHRDHADAAALAAALGPDAPVLEPETAAGTGVENLALAQAEHELDASGVERRRTSPWQRAEVGPFTVTAIPAVDGLGDPQLSWLVEADGRKALHLGDTMFHGYWWRLAQINGPIDVVLAPINGPLVEFPHRAPASPVPVAMDPEQAALAGELIGAGTLIPIHYDGYAADPWYRPTGDPLPRFLAAAEGRGYAVESLAPGASLELEAVTTPAA